MFYQTLKFNLNERNDWLQNNTANQTNSIPIQVNNHGLNKLFNMRSDSYRDFIDEYAYRVTYLPVFFNMESDGVRTISDVLKAVKHDTDKGLTIAIDDLVYLADEGRESLTTQPIEVEGAMAFIIFHELVHSAAVLLKEDVSQYLGKCVRNYQQSKARKQASLQDMVNSHRRKKW